MQISNVLDHAVQTVHFLVYKQFCPVAMNQYPVAMDQYPVAMDIMVYIISNSIYYFMIDLSNKIQICRITLLSQLYYYYYCY